MIIDELGKSYHRSALAACSVTCRAWLHRSRVHIHAAVRIDPTSHLDHLTELYTSPLADYVHSLSIDACDDGTPVEHSWIDSSARPLLRQFTKVERLSLDGIVWDDLEHETQQLLLTQYPLVTDLWVSTCDFWNPHDFLHLLQALPRLESVRMEGVGCEAVDCEDVLRNNAPELRLRWLDVGDICSAPSIVAQWAWSHRKNVAVENVHFSWGCEDPVDLGRFLQIAGSSVKTLSITMDDRVQRWAFPQGEHCRRVTFGKLPSEHLAGTMRDSLSLGHNTGLQKLRLLLRLETHVACEISWISDILAQLSSPLLKNIYIYVEVLFYEQLGQIRWDQIDSALSHTRLKSLRSIELCVLRRSTYGSGEIVDCGVTAMIKGALPGLASKGILHVMQQLT